MKIKENLVLRRIGSEYVIIVPGKDTVDMTKVYSLNETSAWIWEQLKNEDFTIEQVVELVMQYYEVDQDRAMCDLQTFFALLSAEELIVRD